jgi:hypothetical protein
MEVTPEALAKLEDTLLNTSGEHPLHNRFRALFTLKAVGGETAIEIIAKGKCIPFFSCSSPVGLRRRSRQKGRSPRAFPNSLLSPKSVNAMAYSSPLFGGMYRVQGPVSSSQA